MTDKTAKTAGLPRKYSVFSRNDGKDNGKGENGFILLWIPDYCFRE
jgi:hypothetical protein